jgi:hypothetical protein
LKIKNIFLTPVDNEAGIYGLTFHIRGKPWVIDVDDKLFFSRQKLIFAQPSKKGIMWGPVLEKAWAKVRTSYLDDSNDLLGVGIRALTGFPIFTYTAKSISSDSLLQTMYKAIQDGEIQNFIMGAQTITIEGQNSRKN